MLFVLLGASLGAGFTKLELSKEMVYNLSKYFLKFTCDCYYLLKMWNNPSETGVWRSVLPVDQMPLYRQRMVKKNADKLKCHRSILTDLMSKDRREEAHFCYES